MKPLRPENDGHRRNHTDHKLLRAVLACLLIGALLSSTTTRSTADGQSSPQQTPAPAPCPGPSANPASMPGIRFTNFVVIAMALACDPDTNSKLTTNLAGELSYHLLRRTKVIMEPSWGLADLSKQCDDHYTVGAFIALQPEVVPWITNELVYQKAGTDVYVQVAVAECSWANGDNRDKFRALPSEMPRPSVYARAGITPAKLPLCDSPTPTPMPTTTASLSTKPQPERPGSSTEGTQQSRSDQYASDLIALAADRIADLLQKEVNATPTPTPTQASSLHFCIIDISRIEEGTGTNTTITGLFPLSLAANAYALLAPQKMTQVATTRVFPNPYPIPPGGATSSATTTNGTTTNPGGSGNIATGLLTPLLAYEYGGNGITGATQLTNTLSQTDFAAHIALRSVIAQFNCTDHQVASPEYADPLASVPHALQTPRPRRPDHERTGAICMDFYW